MKDEFLDAMINEAPGQSINFTMFLTLFGEKLTGTDPEEVCCLFDHHHQQHLTMTVCMTTTIAFVCVLQVIKNAFQCFDDEMCGQLNEDRLRELLTTMGDRYTDDQVSNCNAVL